MKGINRMRRQDFLNNFGGYYLMLEKKLMTTFNYVEEYHKVCVNLQTDVR